MPRGHLIGKLPFRSLFLIVLLAPLLAVGKGKPALAAKGDRLDTQSSLYYEKGHHITTNYRVGILVPANTEVECEKSAFESVGREPSLHAVRDGL